MFGEILRSFLALERERHASRAVWHARSTRNAAWGRHGIWIDYVEHFLVDAKGGKVVGPVYHKKKRYNCLFRPFSVVAGRATWQDTMSGKLAGAAC
jgi:hypothetical protein